MEAYMGIEERAAPTFQHWNITHLAAPSHCLTFPEQALQEAQKETSKEMKSFLCPLKETFNDCLYPTFNLECLLFIL